MEYINKLSDKSVIERKYFWLTIYAIIKEDKESAMSNYNNFLKFKNIKSKFTSLTLEEILEALLNCDSKEKKNLIKQDK